MLIIAYSKFSAPSAQRLAEQGEVDLVRSSTTEVDVNWGRATANSALNPDTSAATNKRLMRAKFAEAGVPMPNLLTEEEMLDRAQTAVLTGSPMTPVLGRPDRHAKRRGMWMITDVASANKALLGTRRKAAATHFMEWVESEREYRCHIFQGRSIRISRKDYSEDKTWLAVRPGDIDLRPVRRAAKQAVEALGLDFGAVDILARGDRNQEVFVLEVNTSPGLGGSMPRVYFETFTQWKEAQS